MKRFLNKYTRSLYTNLNKKIYIAAFVLIIALIVWSFISNLFIKKDTKDAEVQNTASLYKPSETIISGKDIKEEVYEEDEELIKKFIEYGNNGKAEEAYNLLSDDCKKIIFDNNIENFKKDYFNDIFKSKRETNLQSWIADSKYNTYRVRMVDDIMSTGNYDNSSNYQDYMTVFENDDKKYLNIKGLIRKNEINAKEETDELEVNVISELVYVDYIEYEFSIRNKTDKRILMDTLQYASDSMYIEITGDKKRSSVPENLSRLDLIVDKYMKKDIKIRYNQAATNNGKKTKRICFKNIIKDYDMFTSDVVEYNDVIAITIEL